MPVVACDNRKLIEPVVPYLMGTAPIFLLYAIVLFCVTHWALVVNEQCAVVFGNYSQLGPKLNVMIATFGGGLGSPIGGGSGSKLEV